MTRLLIVIMLASGCAGTFGERNNGRGALGHVNRIGAGVAVLSIACDGMQTYGFAAGGWRNRIIDGREKWVAESNPLLGEKPSTAVVTLYMSAAIVATVVVGNLLPSRLRPLFYGSIVALETKTIASNVNWGSSIACGIGAD